MLSSKIMVLDKGLKPRPGNRFVYVTTDKDVALRYAKAWTAWAVHDVAPELGREPNYNGALFTIKVNASSLEKDPYNPEDEPDQYRFKGVIPAKNIVDYQPVKFDDLKKESELNRNYAFWIGIARATDD